MVKPTSLQTALKEWDLACRLLTSGQQTVLIRKGGLWEPGGRFVLKTERFLLFPTLEHQKLEMLRPEYHHLLAETQPDLRGSVTIEAWAETVHWIHLQNLQQAAALSPEHPWNDRFAALRFEFNPYDPVTALFLRVYRLPQPVVIPMRSEFVGCRSWLEMGVPINLAGSSPSLSEDELQSRIETAVQRVQQCGGQSS